MSDADELNLLCCVIAKQVGDDCATIARVRTPDYSMEIGYLREKLGLTMVINPELEAARETSRILYLPTALELNSFAHGQAEIVKFKIPKNNILDGISISELGRTVFHDILVCAVERDGEVTIPSGGFQLLANDIVSFEGRDLVTTFTAVAATINNIGPGLNEVGPACNFGILTGFSKWVLIFDMLAGRLELFPLLILFHPHIWRDFFGNKIKKRRLRNEPPLRKSRTFLTEKRYARKHAPFCNHFLNRIQRL